MADTTASEKRPTDIAQEEEAAPGHEPQLSAVDSEPASTVAGHERNNVSAHHDPKGEDGERNAVFITHRKEKVHRRLPFRQAPLPYDREVRRRWLAANEEDRDNDVAYWEQAYGPYIAEEHRASEWVSLFYDLVLVAVLSTFSASHEVQEPGAIPVYFSYYVVLIRIWTAQLHYDATYEADDTFHRIFKALQIALMLYIGAASNGWHPGKVLGADYVPQLDAKDQVKHASAASSFLTVVIAFAVSRAFLAFEWLCVILSSRRIGRPSPAPQIYAVTLIISMIFSIIAVALHATTQPVASAKVGLFYAGILVEILGVFIQPALRIDGPLTPDEYIAERYGALSLIILGEGFITLTKVFGNALVGLGQSHTAYYAQVFLVILVIYNIWNFMFSHFSKHDTVNPMRSFFWEVVHYPLHFGILLLLSAMTNSIIGNSFNDSLSTTMDYYYNVANATLNGTAIAPNVMRSAQHHLNRLNILPSFATEYKLITRYINQTDPLQSPELMVSQYAGQIILSVASRTGVEVGAEPFKLLEQLVALDTTSANETIAEVGDELVQEVIKDLSNEVAQGLLWLYPVAGCVLILIAIRSLLRYKFKGHAQWIVNGTQMIFGVFLALLGLLDLGHRNMWSLVNNELYLTTADNNEHPEVKNTSPLYSIAWQGWALAIVAIVYTLVNVFTKVLHAAMDWTEVPEGEDKSGRWKRLRSEATAWFKTWFV